MRDYEYQPYEVGMLYETVIKDRGNDRYMCVSLERGCARLEWLNTSYKNCRFYVYAFDARLFRRLSLRGT